MDCDKYSCKETIVLHSDEEISFKSKSIKDLENQNQIKTENSNKRCTDKKIAIGIKVEKQMLSSKKHSIKKPDKQKHIKIKTDKTNITCEDTGKHITQEIQVGKQEFKCIINLNTTVCNHKSNHACKRSNKSKHKYDEKHRHQRKSDESNLKRLSLSSDSAKKRILPMCFRDRCKYNHQHIAFEKVRQRVREAYPCKLNVNQHHQQKSLDLKKAEEREPKQRHHHHHRCQHRHDYKRKAKTLSPISMSPLGDDLDHLYEDISSASLDTIEKPPNTHMRGKRKHRCRHRRLAGHDGDIPESKLDTLIKRTKQRERILVEESRQKSWFASTPIYETSSDVSLGATNMDISFQSMSTLLLDPNNLPYSPSCPIEDWRLNSDNEQLTSRAYSPSSPENTEEIPRYIMKTAVKKECEDIKIKTESMVDIEAYSPIHSPDEFTLNNKCSEYGIVKLKSELFSTDLSPIYYERSDNKRLCKIVQIKSEFVDG